MEKKVLLIIEILALSVCLISGVLWIIYPTEPYEPTFAVSGLTFIITEVYRRLKTKQNSNHSFLEIDSENTLLCKYMDGGKMNGHIALLFYGLKIVNASENSFTIKDVKLEYTYNSKKYSVISNVVITGTVFSPQTKKDLDSLIVYVDNVQVVIMGWENIRTKIGEHPIIEKNGVLSGSALFLLEFKEIQEIRKIDDFQITISDHSKKYSKHPIKIEEEWIERGGKSSVKPRNFTSDGNGKINYT
nr:hypothetical protein [uncultured Allomuricauda sp.]